MRLPRIVRQVAAVVRARERSPTSIGSPVPRRFPAAHLYRTTGPDHVALHRMRLCALPRASSLAKTWLCQPLSARRASIVRRCIAFDGVSGHAHIRPFTREIDGLLPHRRRSITGTACPPDGCGAETPNRRTGRRTSSCWWPRPSPSSVVSGLPASLSCFPACAHAAGCAASSRSLIRSIPRTVPRFEFTCAYRGHPSWPARRRTWAGCPLSSSTDPTHRRSTPDMYARWSAFIRAHAAFAVMPIARASGEYCLCVLILS